MPNATNPPPLPKPGHVLPSRSSWHLPTWQQLMAWASMIAAAMPAILQALGTLHLPPWVSVAGVVYVIVVGALTRSPGSAPNAQVDAIRDEMAMLRASLPVPRPQTIRGDVPAFAQDHVDQDAPTTPGKDRPS